MRSFLYIFIGLIIISFNAYGDGHTESIEDFYISRIDSLKTICIDGYKFVVVQEWIKGESISVSMVQFYENQNGNAVPAKC